MHCGCQRQVIRFLRNLTGQTRWVATESQKYVAMWGNGDYGRLGLGDFNSQWKPIVCQRLTGENPSSISSGGAHTLFLTEEGRVFATGMNDFGQLGIPTIREHTAEPCEVPGFLEKVIKVSAGYRHSSAITADGALYMWGDNSSGQLGLGKKAEKIVTTPIKVDTITGLRIETIALGSEHSVAITENGDVLSWGSGGSGQLGHGRQSSMLSEYMPRLIKTLEGAKVRKISAGLLHSACINENGLVFMFGQRTTDQLGFGDTKIMSLPSLVSELPFSWQVSCGAYHTCVITSDGELYTWGTNENGCLGLGYKTLARKPERIEGPMLETSVSEVSCGWKHTAAICGGNVFTWGWGGAFGTFSDDGHSSGGQLGHGNDFDYFEPTMVDFGERVRVVHVSCGFNHTGAIFTYA